MWHAKFSAALDTLWNRSTTITSWRRHKRSFERPSSSSWHRQTTQRKRSQSGSLFSGRDFPTDRVEDYCAFLGQALSRRGIHPNPIHVDSNRLGWTRSLWRLWRESASWQGNWVLFQFTSLAWSRRGFPFGVLFALRILRRRGARVAVVFHETVARQATKLSSIEFVELVRTGSFKNCMPARNARSLPMRSARFLGFPRNPREQFSSIGANIPEPESLSESAPPADSTIKTITIFCLTDPRRSLRQFHCVRFVASAVKKIRVVFLGRGTREATGEIDRPFAGIPAEVVNLGVLPAADVSYNLTRSTVMLCVRGSLFPRRGSAIAGIACGLPIVGYAGPTTTFPITEGGWDWFPKETETR